MNSAHGYTEGSESVKECGINCGCEPHYKCEFYNPESPVEDKTQERWDWSTKSPELKALCWVLDKIWAKVSPAEEATTSWGRQESGRAIEAYTESLIKPIDPKTQESQEDRINVLKLVQLFQFHNDDLNKAADEVLKEWILTRRNPK